MAQASAFNILALQGKRLIMQVTPPLGTPPRQKPSVLTVDGQIIPGTEDASFAGPWFSPDGNRYAILCQRSSPQPEMFLIVDGKKELSYQNIINAKAYAPSFSPDSTKLAYLAQSATGTFLVINSEESDPLQSAPVFTWSSTGSRYAWGGMTSAQKRVFYIDGKSIAVPPRGDPSFFQFSPDNQHTSWAYGNPSGLTLVVDGSPINDVIGQPFVGATAFDGQDAIVKFSPDGKHVVYAGRDSKNPSRQGIWVDGKMITPFTAPQINRVTFTPDSQHVAWAVPGLKDNVGVYRVFVDGREVLASKISGADNTAGTWEMGSDGTLTFLGFDGDALKRFRIPPPGDSSIATMLAAAK
jgi:dipeptidyl aminopeptidase/acylaminoacyl peptidase